jgi:hypothetical protein
VGRWVEAECERCSYSSLASELKLAYDNWSDRNGEPSMNPKVFAKGLERAGLTKGPHTNKGTRWDGIRHLRTA